MNNVDNDLKRALDVETPIDDLSVLAIHSDERVRIAAKSTRRAKQIRALHSSNVESWSVRPVAPSEPIESSPWTIMVWSDAPTQPGWYVVKKRGLASPMVLKWTGKDKGSWARVTMCFGPIPDHK